MTPELENRLADLAARLGTSADRVWAALVKQAALHGLQDLAYAALALLCAAATVVAYVALWRWPLEKTEYFDPALCNRLGGGLLAALVLVVFATIIVDNVYDAVSNFSNPEFFALERLSKLFKP